MYLLAKHPHVQELLYHEVVQTNTSEPSQELLQEMKLLTAVILESLRLMPPIGQLVNRRAAQDTFLGTNMYIPRGTYLGYNSYSTNRDPQAWGPDPDAFVPQRWGATMAEIQKSYRRRRARAEFISFHGGRRACLGERFAMLQLKVSLFVLIKSLRWRLDPSWKDQITPAGPICPRALKLIIESRDGLEG
ncbi:hypothetical protein CDD82_3582 [Ophiocordyceps australis]|uniref:Cytochrome P450 n=1 Tax=Ophiocordyceps australis TaxID=1399860 RepID=A0A2C5Z8D3_9HYPO|nr:hypothetical protein CDD82_3582 [Ophiocordyceps australis]